MIKLQLGRLKKNVAEKILVGQVPIEICKLLAYFLAADEGNKAVVIVAGVVPRSYVAFSKNRCFAKILLEKLKEEREKFHFCSY